jgi:tetratricopeptide (TPR) repeat protein
MSGIRLCAAVLVALTSAACARLSRVEDPMRTAGLSHPGDAPYELADDQDLELVRGEYEALWPGEAGRAALRDRLAAEYARRMDLALRRGDHKGAHERLVELVTLWQPEELAKPELARQLAPYRTHVQRTRAVLARAGSDRETALTLAVLREIIPERASYFENELAEVFAYADDLAEAEFGQGARRARSIEVMEDVVDAFPSRFAVAQLVALYTGRHAAIDKHFRRNGADFQVIRAHGQSVLRTTWNLVRIHARAGRIDEALHAIAGVTGLGDDQELRRRLQRAFAAGASAGDWVQLAQSFRHDDPEKADPVAALRICLEAIRRHPGQPEGFLAAGGIAAEESALALAIRLYERARALAPGRREASLALARLYEARVTNLAFSDRPRAALRTLATMEQLHAEARQRWHKPLSPDLADAYAAMGRGLIGLGEIARAREYLGKSLALRRTLTALELLGTVALKRGEFAEAARHLSEALRIEISTVADQFDRNRILRLAGEAYEGAGDRDKARVVLQDALRAWNGLKARYELQANYQAELLIETGKVQWALGEREAALASLEAAIDADPDGASTHADVVAFLVVNGEYERAVDAFHRGLGSYKIGDYFKVYMSLWVLAEARRLGLPEDPLARDYLHARRGELWFDALASYATGRRDVGALRDRATTRGRRAELLYYSAVLIEAGRNPQAARDLLRSVLATDMLLFFEYDMARAWLRRGFAQSRRDP